MVSEQIIRRGINNPQILQAFRNTPRHLFVLPTQQDSAYMDCPLPIGCGQTISQPYMVALMTQSLNVSPEMSVLEVGTGSGYQAAILSFLGAKVYSIERFSALAQNAMSVLASLGYAVTVKVGDGTLGWQEHSPYDRIIVTAAAPHIPSPLLGQLKIGGRIAIPLGGSFHQDLAIIDKISEKEIKEEMICGCIFVPLIGEYGYKE